MSMGIQEYLAKRPAVGITLAVIAISAAVIFAIHTLTAADPANHLANTYFTDDDGASFFAGEGQQIESFERRSKPAHVAAVYSCDGSGGHRFVAYITRHTASAMKAVDDALAAETAARSKYAADDPHVIAAAEALAGARTGAENTAEIKRPGASSHWVAVSSPEGQDIAMNVKCPDGAGVPQMVLP